MHKKIETSSIRRICGNAQDKEPKWLIFCAIANDMRRREIIIAGIYRRHKGKVFKETA